MIWMQKWWKQPSFIRFRQKFPEFLKSLWPFKFTVSKYFPWLFITNMPHLPGSLRLLFTHPNSFSQTFHVDALQAKLVLVDHICWRSWGWRHHILWRYILEHCFHKDLFNYFQTEHMHTKKKKKKTCQNVAQKLCGWVFKKPVAKCQAMRSLSNMD